MQITEKIVSVRPSVKKDVEDLFWRLRKSDITEIWNSHHAFPKDALKDGFKHSILCFSIVIEDRVCGMYGIRCDTLIGDRATIWMLGSPEIEKIRIKFLRNNRKYIDLFLSYYPILMNWVDVDNKKSIAWLKWLGAEIGEPERYGVENKLFRKFKFSRKE
jgi:hypothetical protein